MPVLYKKPVDGSVVPCRMATKPDGKARRQRQRVKTMKKNTKATLLDAVYSCKLWGAGYIHAAQAVPLYMLITASKFERGQVAALSMREQKEILSVARDQIRKGNFEVAKLYIESFKMERRAYNNLFTFGSK